MSVKIESQPVLTYNDGEKWLVPLNLVVEHAGRQWLKISPINYGLVRTICYDRIVPKNASFSVCGEIENMKRMRNEAAQQPEQTPAEELFQSDGQPSKKKRKPSATAKKEIVSFEIAGSVVQRLAPRSRQSEDLHVLIEEMSLEAVFHAIRNDVPWPHKDSVS